MIDWFEIWQEIGRQHGFGYEDIEPKRMTIGAMEHPEKLTRELPVFWVTRATADLSLLDFHKRIVERRHLSTAYHQTKGAEVTLENIASAISPLDSAPLAPKILPVLTAASLHEYGSTNSYRTGQRRNPAALKALRRWVNPYQRNMHPWHRTSATLGPDSPFDNHREVTSSVGQVESTETKFFEAIVLGHKHIFEEYKLVVPQFQREPPEEIYDAFYDWFEEREEHRQERKKEEALAEEQNRQTQRALDERREEKRRELLAPEKRDIEFQKLNWRNTSDEKLQALIFEAPLTELAIRFGVSEAAIRKRIKNAKLEHPPQGHWLKGKKLK